MTASTLELRERNELRQATRALLREPFVGPDDAAFPLVRRHEPELARRFAHLWGYRLDVTPGFARLYKRPTDAALSRPLRIPPGTRSGRERPRDEWPRLDPRRATLLFLTMAALERSRQQTVVGDLARDVAEAGSSCDPPLEVDFDQRSERLAFADVLDLLCHWAVLRLDDGSRASFATREPGEDEALFTIDRKRLASLLRNPFRSLATQRADDLADDSDDYAATDDGANLRIRHRLARMLTEDPVLYVDRLTEAERAYFHRQRAYLETLVTDYTGLVAERRAEGSACIEPERMLTDLPFPANSTRKQAALLLCDVLAAAGPTVLSRAALRQAMHALVSRHGASWNRNVDDPVEVDALLDDALGVLAGLDLVERAGDGVRPLPLCGRFRDPRINRPRQED